MKFFKNWRLFLPILYLRIQIPFFSIHTSVMYERMETGDREYISLEIRFYKWFGDFALYTTRMRRHDR